MKANLFDVLKKINLEREQALHAYFSDNIMDLHAGRDGWGSLKIAITTGDAQELMGGVMGGKMKKRVLLFVVDSEAMEAVKAEIEGAE